MKKKRYKELVTNCCLNDCGNMLECTYDLIAMYEKHPWIIEENSGLFFDILEELERKVKFLLTVSRNNLVEEDVVRGLLD